MSDKERILVVDDDPSILNLLGVALKQSGFEVECANNGFVALEIMDNQPPFSVALLDLMMPGINGQELAKRVKTLDPTIEIVIITAAPALESAIATLRAGGAYDYLIKPFDSIGQVALTVERAAGHRRLSMEREALQKRIKAEAEWLQALIADTGDAILSGQENGTITVANPAAMSLLNVPELVGKLAADTLPNRLSELIENWQQVGGSHPAMVEMPWLDGTIQLVNLTPVHDTLGRKGWVAVLRDITHVKQLEELKRYLFIETAHKIRLPLAQAVNAMTELSEVVSVDPRSMDTLFRLTRLWEQIQEWVDDIVTLIHLSSDQNIKIIDLDIYPILQTLAHEFDSNPVTNPFADKNLHLAVDVKPGLPRVHTDPDLLRRLLRALLARAAMRSKVGATIRIFARQNKGEVWIDVCDDGPEVSTKDIPYVFAVPPFNMSNVVGYTGMELAMVKTIMDRIGGQVWVGNEEPQGSVITICLQ